MAITVGTAVAFLDLDTSKFSSGIKTAGQEMKGFTDNTQSAEDRFKSLGSGLQTVGAGMTLGVTAPLVAIGTVAVMTAANFEHGMSKVSALSGATGDDLQMLEDKARELGKSTIYSATEASEGLQYMALAGWEAEEMAAALEPTLLMAGAAGMDLGLATDIVTDTMSMFGMEASEATKMTDMLAYAQANSNTDIEQLGEAMKYAGGAANAMGYDLADTTAILGIFADNGLKGSSAGTTLTAMLSDMKKNAKDGAIAIGDTNVAIVDSSGNYRDMAEILSDVEDATVGMTQAEKDMALSSIWGTQAIKGINHVLNDGTDALKEFEDGIRSSDGASKEMYDIMNDNLIGALEGFKSAMSEAAISIGDALIPAIKSVTEFITKFIDKFNDMGEGSKKVVVAVMAIVAAIGPVILIVGKFVSAIGTIIGVVGKVGPIIVKLGGIFTKIGSVFSTIAGFVTTTLIPAIAAISAPVWIVIGVIAALVGIGVALYKNWDTVKEKAAELTEWIGEKWDQISEWTSGKWEGIKETLSETWGSIKESASERFESIKSTIGEKWDNVKEKTSQAWSAIQGKVEEHGGGIQGVVGTYMEAYKKIFDTGWNFINKLTGGKLGELRTIVVDRANRVKESISTAWNNIKTTTSKKWQEIKQEPGKALRSLPGEMMRAGKDIVQGLINGLNNKLKEVRDKAREIASAVSGAVKNALRIQSPSRVFMGFGENLGEGLEIGMDHSINDLKKKSLEMANAVQVGKFANSSDFTVNKTGSNEGLILQKVEHTGVIRVEGVNDRGDLVGAVDVIVKDILRKERRT